MDHNIIVELKEEHVRIVDCLNEIDMNGAPEKVKELMKQLQVIVVKHLQKEDAFIYPELFRSKNDTIVSLGRNFLDSMVTYATIFQDVTRRIEESPDGFDISIKQEYEDMCGKIKDRIFIEEKALFPAYEGFDENMK